MSPAVRPAAAVCVLVLTAGYHQLPCIRGAQTLQDHVIRYSALITEVRDGVARSPRPDLYAPGTRYGFGMTGKLPPEAAVPFRDATRAALAPALVADGSNADRVVVFFPDPAGAAAFDHSDRWRRLDRLSPHVGVYQRGGK